MIAVEASIEDAKNQVDFCGSVDGEREGWRSYLAPSHGLLL
jgi:hypothetical protein